MSNFRSLKKNTFFWDCHPRTLLFVAAGFDIAGQLGLLVFLVFNANAIGVPIKNISALNLTTGWILFCTLLYVSLGWLFGSYTVLRWRRLPYLVLIQRVLLTAFSTLVITAVAHWLFNPEDIIWLLHRRFQFLWISSIFLWSIFLRIILRNLLSVPDFQQLAILASKSEVQQIKKEWDRIFNCQPLRYLELEDVDNVLNNYNNPSLILVVGNNWTDSYVNSSFLRKTLENLDPRRVQIVSPSRLFEIQQERLPPSFLVDGWMTYDEIPWVSTFGLQTQIKRAADITLALFLILITLPIFLITIIWIRLDDSGPVFYQQQRTGWMGKPFIVYKLRTMIVQSSSDSPSWTKLGDNRITKPGKILRRLRIDELPQLLNVLKGDMSLIGPRPERPQMEEMLESNIPHYRMRHYMRPGLSGWAQVCAPYASSIEDSDLKLSYDLYYLKNFNIWLDIVILFRTIKTILKASGR